MNKKALFVVGDSTLASFNDPYYYPRFGYATKLNRYFKNIEIVNLALSGRSSKSFIKEENYKRVFEEIRKGDYLLIDFAHNDEQYDDALRFTNASLPMTDPSSFSYYLNTYYIAPAKAIGAIPILCTPVCRADSKDDYEHLSGHKTMYGDYRAAILDLGNATDTIVIDLTLLTKRKYQELGFSQVAYYYAIIAGKYDEKGRAVPNFSTVDTTHLNSFGASYVAYLFARELLKTNHGLKEYIDVNLQEPLETELLMNPNYTIKEYQAPDLASYQPREEFKTLSKDWYGTAFGDIDCNEFSSSLGFVAKEIKENVFRVGQAAEKLNGKLSLSTDAFAFCFRQMEVHQNFILKAKAKVLQCKPVKQAGFGIMLRDDCYLNQSKGHVLLASNYIASGLITTDTSMNPIFFKENITLKKEVPVLQGLYKENEEAYFSIRRIGQSVECEVEFRDTLFKKVYVDFDFLQIDQKYMYIGLFATKGTLVEFYDVQFENTGKIIGA